MTKNFVAHRVVIDYSLIIGNNQWLINWLPIDYLLITHWFHWCHWCHRLVMPGHVVLEWAFKKAFKKKSFQKFSLTNYYRSSKCIKAVYPRLSLSFLWFHFSRCGNSMFAILKSFTCLFHGSFVHWKLPLHKKSAVHKNFCCWSYFRWKDLQEFIFFWGAIGSKFFTKYENCVL